MAYLRKKIKKGKEYYYLCENARVDGKPRCVKQIYLGTIEKIAEAVTSGPSLKTIEVKEFGSVWLADLIEKKVGFAHIVDEVLPRAKHKAGASIGEYFLCAAINRMIDARSKHALPGWFKTTAIDELRGVDVEALSSDGFWKKWSMVKEEHIRLIAARLFEKLAQLAPCSGDCFLFDTTNYYTYMASHTPSELAKRGKNKEGKYWLRQVGLALLVTRSTRMPLHYREYEGNRHDSKVFAQIMGDLLEIVAQRDDDVTVVFDKGMNAPENFAAIDAAPRAHFITTYSPYYEEDLIHVDISRFLAVDTPKNKALREKSREDDMLLAFRTTDEYWGAQRVVLVTYNPLTAAKQRYSFDQKLQKLQGLLYELRSQVRANPGYWKNEARVLARYHADCEELHLPKDLYDVQVENKGGQPKMGFRKNHYRIGRQIDRFGKNILISDRHDWSTEQIVMASLDRYEVEQEFRESKAHDHVAVQPIRHWTDGKIRCHILTCIATLCFMRVIEHELLRAGVKMTAACAMEHMRSLNKCLCLSTKNMQPIQMIEKPTPEQSKILEAFGHKIVDGNLRPSK